MQARNELASAVQRIDALLTVSLGMRNYPAETFPRIKYLFNFQVFNPSFLKVHHKFALHSII